MSRFDELTAYEVAQAEQITGVPISAVPNTEVPSSAIVGALAWQHVRRTEPGLSYDDYMRRSSYSEPSDYLFDEPEDVAGFPDADGDGPGEGVDEGELLPGAGDPTV